MTLKIVAALLALASAGATNAQQATSPFYAEVGYTALAVRAAGNSLRPDVVRGIIGYNAHPNMAIEAMVSAGSKRDSTTEPWRNLSTGTEVKIKHALGVYIKPKLYVADRLELFGRLGFNQMKITARDGSTFSDSDYDFAYGLGATYDIGKAAYLALDYMNYYQKDGVKGDGITFGAGLRF